MSRSFKKNYVAYAGFKSNKPGKHAANKSIRRANKAYLKGAEEVVEVYDIHKHLGYISEVEATKAEPRVREVSNVYDFPSDGLATFVSRGVIRK